MTGAWRRRWYVVLLGVLVIGASSGLIIKKVQPVYGAASVMALVPPMFAPRPGTPLPAQIDRNPFFAYTDSIDILSSLAVNSVTSHEVRVRLQAQGLHALYSAQNFREGNNAYSDLTPGAEIYITADAHDPTTAINTLTGVQQAVRDYLAQLQWFLGAPANTWVGSEIVMPPQVALMHGSRTRSAAALGLLGIIGLLVGVPLADRILLARTARRRRAKPRRETRPDPTAADRPTDRVPVGAR